MNDHHDRAEQRLRAADPAGPSRPLPPSRLTRAELIEEIMTTTEDTAGPAVAAKPSRSRWLLSAAAVIVAAAVATTVALTAGGGSSSHPKTVKHLAMGGGGGNSMQMCIQFSVDALKVFPVAFSGTVATVADDTATIDVDHWYKGGDADQVEVTSSGGFDDGIALEGGINFEVGKRYLVTADDGTVSMCGFSGEWTAEMEQAFQEAFGA